MIPVGLAITVQHQSGVQGVETGTEAHVQEIAQLVQSALQESGEGAGSLSDLASLSTAEINAQIHSTIEEAIKAQQKEKQHLEANSKLGFLQKVVTLECFFGGSDCLFRDKNAMMNGQVTEAAKKKFAEGNTNVSEYLTQMKEQVHTDLSAAAAIKSLNRAAPTNDEKVSFIIISLPAF